MKILIVTNHSYMLWRFRRQLIAALQEQGEVVISTPFVGHEDDFRKMGCRMVETELDRRGINPVTDLKLFRFYRKLLKEEKPDVVITYSIKPNVYAGFLCRLMRIPYCVNVQGLGTAFQKQPMATIATLMYRTAVKKAKTVFFENDFNAAEFVDRKICPKSQQTVLNGAGVDLEDYAAVPYPSEEGGVHLLYLGRIMKEKGVGELFQVAPKIKEKYGDKVVFDVVGFFEDEYKELVEDLGEKGVIVFHGFQPDPKPYYAMSHAVLLPSYHEGMSNVLLESAATARALITTDIPGCREAVREGENGFLCKKEDTQTLKTCMEKFLDLTEQERCEMGQNSRKVAQEVFSRAEVVKKTVKAVLEESVKI